MWVPDICIHLNDFLNMDNTVAIGVSLFIAVYFPAIVLIMDIACFKTGRGKENDERILSHSCPKVKV